MQTHVRYEVETSLVDCIASPDASSNAIQEEAHRPVDRRRIVHLEPRSRRPAEEVVGTVVHHSHLDCHRDVRHHTISQSVYIHPLQFA
jgi:hypothetical protein